MKTTVSEKNSALSCLKLPQLLARLAISKSEAYRRLKHTHDFPKPIHLGVRSVVWVESELEDYIRRLIAKRDGAVK